MAGLVIIYVLTILWTKSIGKHKVLQTYEQNVEF